MKNKVVYISVFILLVAYGTVSGQKSNITLLPSSGTELRLYDMDAEEFNSARSSHEATYSNDANMITPDVNGDRKYARKREHRICKMIGSLCKKKWSAGLIKLYKLPASAEIRIN